MADEQRGRGAYTAAEVRAAGPAELNFADGGHSLLADHVPAGLTDARFEVPIDPDGRLRLAWSQPNRDAALAGLGADGRTLYTAAVLPGRAAWADFVAARTTEAMLEGLPWARASGASVTLPADRPLTVLTPHPPTANDADRRRVFLWTLGLSVAVFERAAAGSPSPAAS